MATTVKKTKLTLHLDDGKNAIINLPEPINDSLSDPDTGADCLSAANVAVIAAVYATDDGAQPASVDVDIITTTTLNIYDHFAPAA